MNKNRLFYLFFFLLIFLLVGCAARQENTAVPTAHLVWPSAPDKAKIEFVREYKILEDTASGKGFWGKVRLFILGPKTANLTRPYGVCTDNNQRLFIADAGGAKVHVFDMAGEDYFSIQGTDDVPLQLPINIKYVDGFLYITDSTQGRILQYDFSKKILKHWSPYQFERPTGLAFDAVSELFYISDSAKHEIIVLDRAGMEQFRFGERGPGEGQLNFPTDLWIDTNRQVYVTDALNSRIQIFSPTGKYISHFGQPGDTPGSFSKPKGVAVDRHGHIFVCDALFDTVQIFDPAGRLLLTFGDNGTGPGQFWMPSGIFIDRQNLIYISDTYNRRIQIFKELD